MVSMSKDLNLFRLDGIAADKSDEIVRSVTVIDRQLKAYRREVFMLRKEVEYLKRAKSDVEECNIMLQDRLDSLSQSIDSVFVNDVVTDDKAVSHIVPRVASDRQDNSESNEFVFPLSLI